VQREINGFWRARWKREADLIEFMNHARLKEGGGEPDMKNLIRKKVQPPEVNRRRTLKRVAANPARKPAAAVPFGEKKKKGKKTGLQEGRTKEKTLGRPSRSVLSLSSWEKRMSRCPKEEGRARDKKRNSNAGPKEKPAREKGKKMECCNSGKKRGRKSPSPGTSRD